MKFKLAVILLAGSFVLPASGQETSYLAEDAGNKYWIRTEVVYDIANGHENKLDVIYPHSATAAVPTVIYIHGGGWIWGDKARAVLEVLPYLQMGWAAVNVEYPMASVSKAPAAVEDCRCALRWIVRNAKDYHIDPTRLVVTGHSAGDHLSLTPGMLTGSDGLDNDCPGDGKEAEPRIASHSELVRNHRRWRPAGWEESLELRGRVVRQYEKQGRNRAPGLTCQLCA